MEPPSTFNELLINEVKAHPSLYDQQQRVCTDNGERNVIWEVIAQRIDKTINGEFAKKRWLQVRDRYRKELKMALRTSVQPKWPYFSKLNWLDPYLKDAKSIKNGSNSPPIHQSINSESGHIKVEFQPVAYYPIEKDQNMERPHLQFPQYQTVNFLETLMAASRDLLEKRHEKCTTEQQLINNQLELFSSSDSAVASTSEENGSCISEQLQLEKNFEENDDSHESFMNVNKKEQNEEKISSLTKLISQRLSQTPCSQLMPNSSPTNNHLDLSTLLNSPPRIANPFGNFPNIYQSPTNSPQISSNRFCRSRNQPPYLVRRGNKQQQQTPQKSKLESNSSTSSPHKLGMDLSLCGNGNEFLGQFPTSEEWTRMDLDNDEDLLFARLVVARLKKFEAKRRREICFAIHQLLDKSEEELEIMETETVKE